MKLSAPFWAIALTAGALSPGLPLDDGKEASMTEVVLFERFHQTFMALNDIVIPAYLEHFRDEPNNFEIVQRFAGRLKVAQARALSNAKPLTPSGDPKQPANAFSETMNAVLIAADRGHAKSLEVALTQLGTGPSVVLQSKTADGETGQAASCPLFDPELMWAHRRLWELKSGVTLPQDPPDFQAAIIALHELIRNARAEPENQELSLRRFLDQQQSAISQLAWLYRCRGVEMERDGDGNGATHNYLRAWAIADARFPASDRGRLDRFDPVFLAELGDIYARLGRFDLMLRYVYADNGLPARFQMARPIAELARVAESVRLVARGETASTELEDRLPETVTQILFDRPVSFPKPPPVIATSQWDGRRAGAIVIACGVVVLVVGVAASVVCGLRRNKTTSGVAVHEEEKTVSRG